MRLVIGLALLALAAVAAVPLPSAPRTPANSLEALAALDSWERSLAPDMADPHPPTHRRAKSATKAGPYHALRSTDAYRLPTNLIPIVHQVMLTPDLKAFTFEGSNIIIVNCNDDTDKIVMHSKQIKVDETSIQVLDDRTIPTYFFDPPATELPVKSVSYDTVHDFLTIELKTAAVAGGRYRISFDFTGILNDDLDGFYRSSYKTSSGETRWLATTQFESTGARRAFPCWDEPSFKARFTVIINHDPALNAISNAVVAATDTPAHNDGLFQDQYDATLPISSYLIAFIVSDFGSVTNTAGNFTTWARKDLLVGDGASVSQDVGQKALQLLADYNGIPYALPKEDQAAIPDFEAGAMENWGLVTYREEYLIKQDIQTIRIDEFMSTTVCHELGHQWTGDLVTLDWWSHTWLNEGFADYFENFICDKIQPGWHLRDKGVVGDHHRGMELDAVETMHAMSSPVSTPDEDSSKFDRISYSKGGAVIRMWEHMLGLDVLKAGMHRYLSINMFANTNPENLFSAIDFEAKKAGVLPNGVSFGQIAHSWTEQPGVPVVTATRDYAGNSISLSQQRFFYQTPNRVELLKQRWFIPITITEQGNADWAKLSPTTWLRPEDVKISVSLKASASDWVLVNPKEIGYYRVNYDVKNWNLLAAAAIAHPEFIPTASRAQLINDALALARGGQLDYAVALQFLTALKADRDVAPWQSGVVVLDWLRTKLAGTGAWANYLTLMKQLTDSAYSAVGYSGSSDHETRFLRFYVVSYACYAGNADCISNANDQLKKWLADSTTKMDADTKAVSMCYGLRGADAASNFAGLKAKWLAETNADTKASLLAALACAKENDLKSLLSDSINNKLTNVDQNTVVDIWQAVLNRPEQLSVIFQFAKNNYQQIDSYFSSGDSNSGAVKLLSNCIQLLASSEQLTDARWWVEDNYKGKSGYDQLQSAFLSVYKTQAWYRSYYKTVASWIQTAVSA